MGEENKVSIGIRPIGSFTLMTFIISMGIGYLETGLKGIAVGAVGAGLAWMLAWLGFLPIIGQILYILLWDKVSSWVHSLVDIKYTLVIPYYIGLIDSIILSILVIIALFVVVSRI